MSYFPRLWLALFKSANLPPFGVEALVKTYGGIFGGVRSHNGPSSPTTHFDGKTFLEADTAPELDVCRVEFDALHPQ